MYIVAIAWLYVTLMMAVTEKNLVAGVMTFVFYGIVPIALVLWLAGGPRRRLRKADEALPGADAEAARGGKADAQAGAPAGATAGADRKSGSVPHGDVQQPDRPDAKGNQ